MAVQILTKKQLEQEQKQAKKRFVPGRAADYRSQALQQMAQEEMQKKADRSLLGKIIGGITDPISRVGQAGRMYLGSDSTPDARSLSAEQRVAYEADPNRYALQRLADVGSIGLMVGAPATGTLGGAVGLGAIGGGLGAVGEAQKGEDLLSAAGTGALMGGLTGGALYGAGKLFEKATKGFGKGRKLVQMSDDVLYGDVKPSKARYGAFNTATKAKDGFRELVESMRNHGIEPRPGANFVYDVDTFTNEMGDMLGQAIENNPKFSMRMSDLLEEVNKATTGTAQRNKLRGIIYDTLSNTRGGFLAPEQTILSGSETAAIRNALGKFYQSAKNSTDDIIVDASRSGVGAIRKAIEEAAPKGSDIRILTRGYHLGTSYQDQSGRILNQLLSKPKTPIGTRVATVGMQGARRAGGSAAKGIGQFLESGVGGRTGEILEGGSGILQNPKVQQSIAQMLGRNTQQPGLQTALPAEQISQGMQGQPMQQRDNYRQIHGQTMLDLINQGISPTQADDVASAMLAAKGMYEPNEMGATQQSGLADLKSSYSQFDNLEQTIRSGEGMLGPVSGRLGTLGTRLGLGDTQAGVQAQFAIVAQQFAKALEGGRLTDKDREFYMKNAVPTVNDTPAQALKKIQVAKQFIESQYNSMSSY